MFRKSRKQLTIRFLQRTVLFLAVFSCSLFLFFVSGNMQHFLDDTQRLILGVLSASALVTVLLAAVLFFIELYLILVRKQRQYSKPLVVALLCMFCAFIFAFFSHVVILLSRGF
jgi:4-hydroxybenzoate polyprenyltransferase